MAIEQINIKIYDTVDNSVVLSEEQTQHGAPQLKFKGDDDEYQPIITSEFSFNMLVPDAADGKFLHLFTGSESRYLVKLFDATDSENLVELWRGNLLPELYNEPYANGSFFVSFAATDGIGQLKNKQLATNYFSGKKSVIEIIAKCLEQTSHNLPIYVAKAITNAVVNTKAGEIEIDTALFYDAEKKEKDSTFSVLEKAIAAMGCQLYQWQGCWYLIGINRKYDTTIYFEKYSSLGVFIENTSVTRDVKFAKFNGTPSITMVPPLKTVTVNYEINAEDDILPDDIVKQNREPGFYNDIKYWEKTESVADAILISLLYKGEFGNYGNIYLSEPFYIQIIGYNISSTNLEQNYLSLENPIYIEGGVIEQTKLDIEIEGEFKVNDTITNNDLLDFQEQLFYEILLNNETFVTNKSTATTDDIFNFEIEKVDDLTASFVVQLQSFPINESGYIDVKLHPGLNDATVSNGIDAVVYKKLTINHSDWNPDSKHLLERDIDYSTNHDVTIDFASSISDLATNKFYVNENVTFSGMEVVIPEINEELAIIGIYVREVEYPYGTRYENQLILSEYDYQLATQYTYSLYVKRQGTTGYEQLYNLSFFENEGVYTMFQVGITSTDAHFITAGDELFIKVPEETITQTDRNYLLKYWKRFNQIEQLSWLQCIQRLYHTIASEPKVKIEGELFEIVSPMDIMQFNFLENKNYNISSLTMDFSEGTTNNIILFENMNKTITDYIE